MTLQVKERVRVCPDEYEPALPPEKRIKLDPDNKPAETPTSSSIVQATKDHFQDSLATLSTLLFRIKCNRPTDDSDRQTNRGSLTDALERMANLLQNSTKTLDQEESLDLFREFEKLLPINSASENDPHTARLATAIRQIEKALHIEEEEIVETKRRRLNPTRQISFAKTVLQTPASRAIDVSKGDFASIKTLLLQSVREKPYLRQIHTVLVGLKNYAERSDLTESDHLNVKQFLSSLDSCFKAEDAKEVLTWPPTAHKEKGMQSLKSKIYALYMQLSNHVEMQLAATPLS